MKVSHVVCEFLSQPFDYPGPWAECGFPHTADGAFGHAIGYHIETIPILNVVPKATSLVDRRNILLFFI
ncbi:hypothetical protein FOCC_FOCC009497 [Frankliniella occidentalis]|nr:hypothetical protein FOCC_FOCC009497 [Frankliniella occidentalis]